MIDPNPLHLGINLLTREEVAVDILLGSKTIFSLLDKPHLFLIELHLEVHIDLKVQSHYFLRYLAFQFRKCIVFDKVTELGLDLLNLIGEIKLLQYVLIIELEELNKLLLTWIESSIDITEYGIQNFDLLLLFSNLAILDQVEEHQ